MTKIESIKLFREKTGLGISEAKKALEESGYNLDKAMEIARSWPLPQRRDGKEGAIFTYNHNNRIGVLLHLQCETDFAAKSEAFLELGHNLCLHIAATGNLDSPYVKDESLTVEQVINDVSAKVKEKIEVVGVSRMEK